MIEIIISYILGMISGVMLFIIGVSIYARRQMKQKISKVMNSVEDALANASIGDLPKKNLLKVKDITVKQLELKGYLDYPQKNSLHGKHKNQIISEVKELEEEKIKLLQEILTAGFDPVVSTLDANGEIQSVKLSEYMREQGLTPDTTPSPADVAKKEREERKSKFQVFSGGKDVPSGDNSN